MRVRKLIVGLLILGLEGRAQIFEHVDSPVSISETASRATAFIDINNDGWLDLFISNGLRSGQNNELFLNDGSGIFDKILEDPVVSDGSPSDGVTFGDVDNDGNVDLYVANWYGEENLFYLGRGDGSFLQVNEGDIIQKGHSETAAWGDANNDGLIDLYIANSNIDINAFLINKNDGEFELSIVDFITRGNTRNVNWIDFDLDGDQDLFITHEFAEKNHFYTNEDGVFTEILEGVLVEDQENSVSSNWIDYDNDGDFDLYVTNIENQNNVLYINEGGSFTRNQELIICQDSNSGFGSSWGDIDNDGDLDLYVTNAFTDGRTTNNLYLSNGDGTFVKVEDDPSVTAEGWSYSGSLGDYDNDGFLDLVVARTFGQSETNLLFHNLGNDHNWLQIDLEGSVSNRSAIGAIVKVTANIDGKSVTQMRDVSSQHGYNCFNALRLHFGLANAETIEKIEVLWPSGNVEIYDNVAPNQFLQLAETIPDDFIRTDFKIEDKDYFVGDQLNMINRTLVNQETETTYSWDFDGDATIDSDEFEPTIAYETAGTYDITLTVSNSARTESKSQSITILPLPLSVVDQSEMKVVYPNPFESQIYISSPEQVESWELFHLDGRKVAKGDNLANGIRVEAPTGPYLLKLQMIDGTNRSFRVLRKN